MLNVGGGELLIIFLVALIFLGPNRLPEVARQIGQTVSSLRSLASGFQAELEAAAKVENYTGPMNLPTEEPEQTKVMGATTEVPPTDPADIAKAARQATERADAEALELDRAASRAKADPFSGKGRSSSAGHTANSADKPKNDGGPTDLRPQTDDTIASGPEPEIEQPPSTTPAPEIETQVEEAGDA